MHDSCGERLRREHSCGFQILKSLKLRLCGGWVIICGSFFKKEKEQKQYKIVSGSGECDW